MIQIMVLKFEPMQIILDIFYYSIILYIRIEYSSGSVNLSELFWGRYFKISAINL